MYIANWSSVVEILIVPRLPLFFPVLSSSSLFFCRGSNNMNSCTFFNWDISTQGWLVVYQPLWKIWVRHLRSLYSQSMEQYNPFMFQTTRRWFSGFSFTHHLPLQSPTQIRDLPSWVDSWPSTFEPLAMPGPGESSWTWPVAPQVISWFNIVQPSQVMVYIYILIQCIYIYVCMYIYI